MLGLRETAKLKVSENRDLMMARRRKTGELAGFVPGSECVVIKQRFSNVLSAYQGFWETGDIREEKIW